MTLQEALTYKPVELDFGTSGLRGLVKDMTDLECYINILGFLNFLKEKDGLKPKETIYVGGDLRESTSRIMSVAALVCNNLELVPMNCGFIPTPALANYAMANNAPCIMVTGSHIPADRNGIKFYKRDGEILKADEAYIHKHVARVRNEIYMLPTDISLFGPTGNLIENYSFEKVLEDAAEEYEKRFLDFFPKGCLDNTEIIVYQHSAVGRDLVVSVLSKLGAKVVPVLRSDVFVPIDTENVTTEYVKLFKEIATDHPNAFAIISTDGDSDRPFVIDEKGFFHRGDVLGLVVAKFLGAKFAATPISSNDAVDIFCRKNGITNVHTKIGSPYVISEMNLATQEPVVGWEVNGGFLTGSDIEMNGNVLTALPTRDAFLPIICALIAAKSQGISISELFSDLPKRCTGGGLIDDVNDTKIKRFRELSGDEAKMQKLVTLLLRGGKINKVDKIDLTDGLRLMFDDGDVIHLRPSGNAPQFRVYTNSDTQNKADELVEMAIKPGGLIEALIQAV